MVLRVFTFCKRLILTIENFSILLNKAASEVTLVSLVTVVLMSFI